MSLKKTLFAVSMLLIFLAVPIVEALDAESCDFNWDHVVDREDAKFIEDVFGLGEEWETNITEENPDLINWQALILKHGANFNYDHCVDIFDAVLFSRYYGRSWHLELLISQSIVRWDVWDADTNGDKMVNEEDVKILEDNFWLPLIGARGRYPSPENITFGSLLADLTDDSQIDIYDAIVISMFYNQSVPMWCPWDGDLNHDQSVDDEDVAFIEEYFGRPSFTITQSGNITVILISFDTRYWCDINRDEMIDIYDAIVIALVYGQTYDEIFGYIDVK